MKETEAMPQAGKDVSGVNDLKAAIGGFVAEFKGFSNGVSAALQKQEDRMNKLDRKTLMANRPVLAAAGTTNN